MQTVLIVSSSKEEQEKEQEVMKTLLSQVSTKIPRILIEEEVNTRLSNLLERLEKLGLSLESYLSSTKKSANDLRTDYENQAKEPPTLDLILNKVAEKENILVKKEEIDLAINAAKADEKLAKELDTPERRKFIEVILKRRKALDSLISLI